MTRHIINVILFVVFVVIVLCASFGWCDTLTVYETIIYEAAGEPIGGQVAVACVIRNRMRERNMTAEEICLEKYQFSCWLIKENRTYTQRELERARIAWRRSADIEFKANLYCRYDCYPYWRDKVEEVARIGNHVFFRE